MIAMLIITRIFSISISLRLRTNTIATNQGEQDAGEASGRWRPGEEEKRAARRGGKGGRSLAWSPHIPIPSGSCTR
eukprot:2946342-Rhodomonas_salina.2